MSSGDRISGRGVGGIAQRAFGNAQRAVDNIQRAWGESPFYQSQLNGPTPDRFLMALKNPYGTAHRNGADLMAGKLSVYGQSLDCEGEIDRAFDLVAPVDPLFRYLHAFDFMQALSEMGEDGRRQSALMVKTWLNRFERWDPVMWEPGLTGARLMSLLFYGPDLLVDADVTWRSRFLSSMARQTRHLALSGHKASGAYNRLSSLFALCLSAAALPRLDDALERGLEMLRRELRVQLRPDGGHVSRNPSRQLALVNQMQLLLGALQKRGLEAPGFLRHLTTRAASYLSLFRVSDGKLATFNGGYEDDPAAIINALRDLDETERSAPVNFARHSGFQRLEGGRSSVIADVGAAPQAGSAPRVTTRHDGGGAFQFSAGRQRIIVNCGAGEHLSRDWRLALRQAAAHSTLARDASDAARRPVVFQTTHRRAEDNRGQLLEIERQTANSAIRHLRRLFLTSGGDEVRGEDVVAFADPTEAAAWRLRFHLHPSVRVSLARDGRSAVLAPPGNDGWRFRSSAPRLAVEKSVYCGAIEAPRGGTQLVISLADVAQADLEPRESGDIIVKWALKVIDLRER